MSNTPRTDAEEAAWERDGGGSIERWINLSRQLERELDSVSGDAATLRGYVTTYRETPTMTAARLKKLEKTNAMLADSWTNTERLLREEKRDAKRRTFCANCLTVMDAAIDAAQSTRWHDDTSGGPGSAGGAL